MTTITQKLKDRAHKQLRQMTDDLQRAADEICKDTEVSTYELCKLAAGKKTESLQDKVARRMAKVEAERVLDKLDGLL